MTLLAQATPFLVAMAWGMAAPQLLMQGWLATVDLVIGIVAFARGRMRASETLGAVLGALITSAVCSVALRLGFFFLVEVAGFGRTVWEQVVFCSFAALSAGIVLRRLPARVGQSWRNAMASPPRPVATPPTTDDGFY